MSQGLSPSPLPHAWPPAEGPEECARSSSANHFLGVCLDSTSMKACLAPAPVESIQSCSACFRLGHRVSVGLCRRILGLMVAASPDLLPTKSIRLLSLRPPSVAGPQFSPERRENGGSLTLPNDNDGCLPLRVGGGGAVYEGRLACGVRQVLHLAHKQPGVESGSSSSHSLSSIPGALSCHRQDGQHGGGVSHQSPGGFLVVDTLNFFGWSGRYHPESLCCVYCYSKGLEQCPAWKTSFGFLLYAGGQALEAGFSS